MNEYLVESLIADLTKMATLADGDCPTPNGEVLRRARAKIESLQYEKKELLTEFIFNNSETKRLEVDLAALKDSNEMAVEQLEVIANYIDGGIVDPQEEIFKVCRRLSNITKESVE